ncbi:putative double-stranded RNA-binding domain-containing protein [Lupinus albus]|uniref:Putative double-stranded RNA-binding domain-containing protein n=1 Tax=Lupinus albus TaxID=3870 RepID=A0A6A4P1G5_LUPAL|nr:putative double-stranded RNA-binding domain-containing protein [Lupinus albus]
MYKTKLQELCNDRKLGLPKYYTIKDGPDHMPTFKATVYVNTVTFTSLSSFTSSKQAQNQAAMLAFNTFSSPSHGNTPLSLI